jgi:Domain of unknown function (DUF4328)
MAEQTLGTAAGIVDSSVLTRWVTWLLYAQIAIAVVAVGSGILENLLLHDFQNGGYTSRAEAMAAGEANDTRQRIVGLCQVAIFIVSGIAILRWIHRANGNARRLGAVGMQFTPGWSVGWYFIPIANLWKPYQAMKEIWQASASPGDWVGQRVPTLLPTWWAIWLVANVLGNASSRLSLSADGIGELLVGNIVTLLSDVSGILLALIFLAIVKRITVFQTSRRTGEVFA